MSEKDETTDTNGEPDNVLKPATLQLMGGGEIKIDDLKRGDLLFIGSYRNNGDYPHDLSYFLLDSSPYVDYGDTVCIQGFGIELDEQLKKIESISKKTLYRRQKFKIYVLGHETDNDAFSRLLSLVIGLEGSKVSLEKSIWQHKHMITILMDGLGIDPDVLSKE